MTVHGGNVWQVAEELGISASEILDFSASVNPRGLPLRARERLARDASDARLLSCYPDPSARLLRRALSEQLGVPAEAIAVGPGAESLLGPVLRAVEAQRVLVPVPAFSEYRRVCDAQRIGFLPFPLERAELFRTPVDRFCQRMESQVSQTLLNNPHNPTGAVLEADEVRRILSVSASRGMTLVLDEAFIDYVPGASLVREAAGNAGLIVIRSLTGFYGCPALRVGYVVAHPDNVARIRALFPAWPVTQLALDALTEAVADAEYAAASLRENAVGREWLSESLSALAVFVFPSAANYLLLELGPDMPAASELRSRLIAKHRILICSCDSWEGLAPERFVRVAVRSTAENRRLIHALREELRLP